MLAVVAAILITAVAPNPPPVGNPPPIDEPTPIEPRADDKRDDTTPQLTPHDDSGAKPDGKAPKPDAKKKRAQAPEVSTGGLGGGPCWGAVSGCGVSGCLPFVGTAFGAGVFVTSISAALAQGGGALGTCLSVVGVGGAVVGAPSVILLGPCASGGALAGGVIGAVVDDRDLAPVFLGALPGVVLGVLASGGAVWGLAVLSSSSGDFQTPAVILGSAAALAIAAGPVTIAGMTAADGLAGSHERKSPPLLTPPSPKSDDDVNVSVSAVVSPRGMAF